MDEGNNSSDEDGDIEDTFAMIYEKCVKNFNWNLNDIDETNLETLMDFLFYKSKPNSNIKIINGKEYKRVTTPPSWL